MSKSSIVALFLAIATSAGAQIPEANTPYVPLDDVTYFYLDALTSEPGVRSLSLLERPYTAAQIRTAIDSALATDLTPARRSYAEAVGGSIARYLLTESVGNSSRATSLFDGDVSAAAQTSGRRELMLAEGGGGVYPAGSLRLMTWAGPVVAAVRVQIDSRLNHDPEFSGLKDRKLAARTQDAYLFGRWKYGELFFGRTERNWGPQLLHGLQLGNYAYSYDHVYGKIGSDKLHVSMVAARLENIPLGPGISSQRYFSIHRFGGRLGRLELAFSESYVYGGEGRGAEPSLLNPLNIFGLSWRDESVQGNLTLGFESAYQTSRFGRFAVQALLDDFQIDDCDSTCNEPSSTGFTFSAEAIPLTDGLRGFTAYTRVSSLTYRTPQPDESYSVHGVGLGRGFSDYDEIRAGLDVAALPRVPLRAYAAFRRQGEGDYRKPFPDRTAVFAQRVPPIFIGSRTDITRVAMQAAGYLRDGVRFSADMGYNFVRPSPNTLAIDKSGVQGRIRVAFERRWGLAF